MSLDGKHIGFIGAGAMAGALAGGLLAGGIARSRVSAADPDAKRAEQLAGELDIRVGDDNAALVAEKEERERLSGGLHPMPMAVHEHGCRLAHQQ